jgi:branched-chain amino acid aminotransferase
MEIDWSNLGFSYIKSEFNVRAQYKNGKWGELEIFESDKFELSIAATCLHYGQQSFEGLKAFAGKDGVVRVFRPYDNAKRMNQSAKRLLMPEIPEKMFIEGIEKAIKYNKNMVPPYGHGASLYIRPLLIGSGETIGVQPSPEYTFMVFVMPVGPYFKEGFKTTKVLVERDTDRAAPLGTGDVKVGGNYAASLVAGKKAKEKGYSTILYLDAKEKKYIDECGPANFFIIKDGKYITPESSSILPSITNRTLIQLAEDMGLTVERRAMTLDDLVGAQEAGACGTAAVISPISKVVDEETKIEYIFGEEPGAYSSKLFRMIQDIQYGDHEDIHDWNYLINF